MHSLTGLLDSAFFALPAILRVVIIIVAFCIIGGLSYCKRFLDGWGLLGSFILGFIVFYIGGVSGIVMLLFFFLSSSLITKLRGGSSSGRRYLGSVAANGIPACLSIILFQATLDTLFLTAFAAALAEATADTWAGEIGQMSKKDPVSILTFTKVPRGISGGVTVLGLAASLLASLLIALLLLGTFTCSWIAVPIITASGFLGALLDSLLGATIQVQYRREDGTLTEEKTDKRARGIPFIDNDMVNFLSGLFSISIAMFLSLL